MKKICLISTGLAGGGMERSLTSLANYFSSKGHQVTIINLFKTDIFFELDYKIKLFWPGFERKKYHRLLYAVIIIPYIRRSIRIINPDVILCFGEWFNSYIILSTWFLNKPLFISDRMGPNLYLGRMLETARKLLYKYTTGIISQTSIAGEILFKKTKAKNIKVIPNAVNVIDTDISIKKKQIVTVGRLSGEKGHSILLKAFAQLDQKDWTLHIIGGGNKKQELINEAKRLGISDRVLFYGYMKDFSEILGKSEIFVLPSLYEGFPNALIEAMSVPLACISSDCIAGPGDIIQNGTNGLLFKTGDEKELCNAIKRLINDTEFRMNLSLEAYKVRENYFFDKMAQQYLDFLVN